MDNLPPSTAPKRRLGQGLDGLLGPAPSASPSRPAPASPTIGGKPVIDRPASSAAIEDVHPGQAQPRTRFEEAALEELTQSIRELGVLEPILVRTRAAGGFEIVAGERRWRAAQRAGLREVPIFIKELTEKASFEAALVENIQRADLNPLETAKAYQRLIADHGHTQESLAARVGKDRSSVANALRLLKLPAEVLNMIEEGHLTEGHGRALLTAKDAPMMLRLAREAREKGLSVRELEKKARGANPGKKDSAAATPKTANTRDLETRLTRALGTRVAVVDREGKGEVVVTFSSYDELDRLIEKFLA